MRAFIVLCLVAVASADVGGYNYDRNSYSGGGGGSIGGGGYTGGSSLGGGYSGGGDSSYGGSYDGGNVGGSEYEKEFYTFSANEGDFHDPNASQKLASSLKKRLQVIFVKSPENKGLEDAALALAKNAANQKTAVYVLHKQTDLDDLASKFNNLRKDANQKPEVHFVKYRTPEDAANAQRQIQGEYDRLGGSSKSINGGVAPAINFASQAPARSSYSSGGSSYGGPSVGSPQSTYLPSSILRRLRFRRL